MAFGVFPSVSNVAGGKPLSEQNLRKTNLADRNWANHGLDLVPNVAVPAASFTVSAGEAVMGGYTVRHDGSMVAVTGATIGANATVFVHLQVTLDGSGNVASLAFSFGPTALWLAGTAPTVYYLCLGRIKTNGTSQITEVIQAVHFPPHGQGFIGRAVVANTTTLANCAADTNYKATALLMPSFIAPRDCLLVTHGQMCVKGNAADSYYAGVAYDATPQTILGAGLAYLGDDRYGTFPLGFGIPLTAGQMVDLVAIVRANTGPRAITIGSGTVYQSWLAAWLTDNTAGL